jgi:hypothetical protein
VNLTLVRHAYLRDCTLGRLYAGDLTLCTLEEPWIPDPDGPGGQRKEPGKRESCVPDGEYRLIPHRRPTGAEVWALVNPALGVYYRGTDIPAGQRWGRSFILIHTGNTTDDIEGCILVGLRHGRLDGKDAVLESRAALERLRGVLGTRETHRLTIRPIAGTSELAA